MPGRPLLLRSAVALLLIAGLAGCAPPLFRTGLKPQYPPAQMTYIFPGQPAFPQVDSLEPTFRWEPLSNSADQGSIRGRLPSDASEITYDLKIFRVDEGHIPWYDQDYSWFQGSEHPDPGQLYYTREKLREPFHKVDRRLNPATKYYWTVRAVIVVAGQPRATAWAAQVVRILWPPGPSQVTYFGFETPER